MKAGKTIGEGVLLLGFVILAFGLANVVSVYFKYTQTGADKFFGSAVMNNDMWNAFSPYLLPSIICWIIGGITYAAVVSYESGNEQTNLPTVDPLFTMASTHKASRIVCGNCQSVNDIDALFCKKCGQKFETHAIADTHELNL